MPSLRCRHRSTALIVLICICLTIVIAVVWKSVSLPSSKVEIASLDSDCHQRIEAESSSAEPTSNPPNSNCYPTLAQEAVGQADDADPSSLQPTDAIDQDQQSVSCSAPEVQDDTDMASSGVQLPDQGNILTGTASISLPGLDDGVCLDPTIPSYAVDDSSQPFDWVLKGPDMYDNVRRYDKDSGNFASHRFMWLAHMNRKNETTSLYGQLGIDESCQDETWVPIAISTAKEIRRQIMSYFVFYSVSHLKLDLTSWNAIQDSVPERVHHRMQVFIAKYESMEWFDEIRKVTQDESMPPWPFGTMIYYFKYLEAIRIWRQSYAHLEAEVEQLSFEGCTRVFKLANDPDWAYIWTTDALVRCIDRGEEICNRYKRFSKTTWMACEGGYKMFDRLPAEMQAHLLRLKALKERLFPPEDDDRLAMNTAATENRSLAEEQSSSAQGSSPLADNDPPAVDSPEAVPADGSPAASAAADDSPASAAADDDSPAASAAAAAAADHCQD